MAGQHTSAVGLQGIPHVAVKVVVAGEQQAAALGEGHGGYAADDVVVGVDHELLVGTQVKEAAGGVIGAGGKSVAIREETNGIDVRLVAGEGLSAHAFTDVPEFSRSVAGTGHKQPGVWSQREAHDITGVAGESGRLLTGLYVPESTGGVARTCNNLVVIKEAAAGEVSCVSGQLAADTHVPLASLQAVNGADVVQSSAGHVIT